MCAPTGEQCCTARQKASTRSREPSRTAWMMSVPVQHTRTHVAPWRARCAEHADGALRSEPRAWLWRRAVGARRRRRVALVAELAEDVRDEARALEGLADGLWRGEQTLEEHLVLVERGAALDARRAQPARRRADEVRPARDVAAGARDRASRVLDERAGHEVRAHVARLARLHELAVAIVDEEHHLRVVVNQETIKRSSRGNPEAIKEARRGRRTVDQSMEEK